MCDLGSNIPWTFLTLQNGRLAAIFEFNIDNIGKTVPDIYTIIIKQNVICGLGSDMP